MKGWRMFLFNAATVGSAASEAILDWLPTVPAEASWTIVALGLINIALRIVTTTPIFKGAEK